MGLNQAHSNYACLYCTVHKDERYRWCTCVCHYYDIIFNRWDVSKNHEERTLSSMEQCLTLKNNKGCINPPLLNIDISRILIDELHLMLRITDILLRNLVWAMVVKKQLPTLVETIQSCGISFQVYQVYNHVSKSISCPLPQRFGMLKTVREDDPGILMNGPHSEVMTEYSC